MSRTTVSSSKRAVSVLVACALVFVSPGLMGYRAFAQAVVRVQVQPGLGALPPQAAGAGLLAAPGAGSRALSGGPLSPEGLMESSLPSIRSQAPVSAAPTVGTQGLAPSQASAVLSAGPVRHGHAVRARIPTPSGKALRGPVSKPAVRAKTAKGLSGFSEQVMRAKEREGGSSLKPVLDRTWEGSKVRPSAGLPVSAGGVRDKSVPGLRPSAGILPGMKKDVPALKSSSRRFSPRTRFLSGSGLAAGVVLFSAETASRTHLLGVLLLAAVGIAIFIYNMFLASKGWKAQRKLEHSFNAYRHATKVREKYEPLLLQYPGSKVVGLHELAKDRWELVVYFSDQASMENAIISSRSLEGIPVRKAVADAEAVQEIVDRIGAYSESLGAGFAPGIGFVEYQYQRLRRGFSELKRAARYGVSAHPVGAFFAALVTAMTLASLGAVGAPLSVYLAPASAMLYAAIKGLRNDHPVSTFFQLLTIGGYYMALAEYSVFGWPALLLPGILGTGLAVWTLRGKPDSSGRQVLGYFLNSLLMWMFTAIFLGAAEPPFSIAVKF